MGTEIQAKTHFSGSYSMMDLNDSVDSGIWALYHECKTLKNDQYYDSFLTRPSIDGYFGYEKEQMRQTILKHESIFRHQLEELHRLYKRQRDLMKEIKCRELHQHAIPAAEMSRSSLFSSHISSGDVKNACHISDFPFMDNRPSTSGTNSIQPLLSFMKVKNISGQFPSQDRVQSKDCEFPESKCNMFQRRLLNLELPAAVHMNSEGKRLEESACGVSGVESCPLSSDCDVTCEKDGNLSLGRGLRSGCNGDTFTSNLYLRRTRDMVDLNEPIQVEEASISASVDNLGHVSCLDEEIRRRAVSGNSKSGYHILSKESSQSSLAGRGGGICLNKMHSEDEGNHTECLTYKNEAGQNRCDTDSFRGSVCPEDSPAPFKSLQVEPSKVDEPSAFVQFDKSNEEPRRKRTIFGVEISEGNHDQSVEASHTPGLRQLIPQSDVAKFERTSLSPWSKASSIFGQDVFSARENACISASFPTNRSSTSLMQSLEFIGGKMQFSSNSKSVSRADASYQHGLRLGSQSDAQQLQVGCSSIGFDFPNGINSNSLVCEQFVPHGSIKHLKVSDCMDVKSGKDMNSNVVSPYRFQNKLILQQNPGPVEGQRKHENPMGGLRWLKKNGLAKIEPIKGSEDSHPMNPHSLQNHSQQFADKTQMGKHSSQSLVQNPSPSMSLCHAKLEKVEVGVCPSNSKILGFPIFVPQTSRDLTSLISPAKSSCLTSDGDGANDRKVLDHNPTSGGELEVKDLATEKGLGNYISGLRHHIDLNLCMNEDEAPPVPSLARAIVKIATTEIDLEAPAVIDSEMDPSPEVNSSENQLKSPSKLPFDESREHNEELVRVAAEAIIAISSSDLIADITCHPLCLSSTDSLHWFAEVVSSYKGDLEGELKAVSRGTDGAYDEESVPDGMDYFEFMTLKLTETKPEEHCNNESPALWNPKDEETGAAVLSKRPRRGQARRGRQRKDFQRDILPGIISLSRHEVTEDLQAIEELFKASGFTWQPILSQRNAAKKGRGRLRLRGSAPSPTPTPVCPPPVEQPIYRELVLEERTLTGWGKRTRRLPRQRCPTDYPTHAVKC